MNWHLDRLFSLGGISRVLWMYEKGSLFVLLVTHLIQATVTCRHRVQDNILGDLYVYLLRRTVWPLFCLARKQQDRFKPSLWVQWLEYSVIGEVSIRHSIHLYQVHSTHHPRFGT